METEAVKLSTLPHGFTSYSGCKPALHLQVDKQDLERNCKSRSQWWMNGSDSTWCEIQKLYCKGSKTNGKKDFFEFHVFTYTSFHNQFNQCFSIWSITWHILHKDNNRVQQWSDSFHIKARCTFVKQSGRVTYVQVIIKILLHLSNTNVLSWLIGWWAPEKNWRRFCELNCWCSAEETAVQQTPHWSSSVYRWLSRTSSSSLLTMSGLMAEYLVPWNCLRWICVETKWRIDEWENYLTGK